MAEVHALRQLRGHEHGSWMKVPSALPEDGAQTACLHHLKARAAPTQPGAPPPSLGSLPWPRHLASACAQDEHLSTVHRQEHRQAHRRRRAGRGRVHRAREDRRARPERAHPLSVERPAARGPGAPRRPPPRSLPTPPSPVLFRRPPSPDAPPLGPPPPAPPAPRPRPRSPQARRFFRHLLAALRHAHARGFLHCDVKPSNVRLQRAREGGELTAVLQPAERGLYPRLRIAPHRPRRAI